jgi:hypothetical protein
MTVSLQMPREVDRTDKAKATNGGPAQRMTKAKAEKIVSAFVGEPVTLLRAGRRTRLINRKAVRGFFLEFAREARPFNKFERVSSDTLLQVDEAVKQFCRNLVRRKPSVGKTI